VRGAATSLGGPLGLSRVCRAIGRFRRSIRLISSSEHSLAHYSTGRDEEAHSEPTGPRPVGRESEPSPTRTHTIHPILLHHVMCDLVRSELFLVDHELHLPPPMTWPPFTMTSPPSWFGKHPEHFGSLSAGFPSFFFFSLSFSFFFFRSACAFNRVA